MLGLPCGQRVPLPWKQRSTFCLPLTKNIWMQNCWYPCEEIFSYIWRTSLYTTCYNISEKIINFSVFFYFDYYMWCIILCFRHTKKSLQHVSVLLCKTFYMWMNRVQIFCTHFVCGPLCGFYYWLTRLLLWIFWSSWIWA